LHAAANARSKARRQFLFAHPDARGIILRHTHVEEKSRDNEILFCSRRFMQIALC
jgi:hypothetical protein